VLNDNVLIDQVLVYQNKNHTDTKENLLQLETVMVTGAPDQMDMVLPANTKTLFIQPEL